MNEAHAAAEVEATLATAMFRSAAEGRPVVL